MLSPSSSPRQSLNSVRLCHSSNTFWDFCFNPKTNQVEITQGNILEGKEDPKSIQTTFVPKCSSQEAQNYASELIEQKIKEGFYHSNDDWELNSQIDGSDTTKAGSSSDVDDQSRNGSIPELTDQKLISISHPLWNLKEQIGKKASELNVCFELGVSNIMVSGEDSAIKTFEEYIGQISRAKKNAIPNSTLTEEEREANQRDHEMGPFIQKTLGLHSTLKVHIDELQQKATELNLICDCLEDKISIAGPQKFVLEFIAWLYDFTLVCLDSENERTKDLQVNDYCESEISISTFHRMHKQEITKRASQLQLELHFAYDLLCVCGSYGNIMQFKSYVHEVEAAAKRSLYPTYWNFHDANPYSEIELDPVGEEFYRVSLLFYNSMKDFEVTRVVRIQNKYLMDHYVTMIQKRQEIRPENQPNRRLLFHSTRKVSPDIIYKNYDTGFDLQYANFGAYGRGLYFAQHAKYSHNGFCHEIGENKWRMLLTDVFTGKSFKSEPNGKFLKAPEGFDSVESAESNYVIYNNFHSYPLYLIDYQAKTVQ